MCKDFTNARPTYYGNIITRIYSLLQGLQESSSDGKYCEYVTGKERGIFAYPLKKSRGIGLATATGAVAVAAAGSGL